jgi:hypothetical protein
MIRELSDAGTVSELLDAAHAMWCGPACGQAPDCAFLHYRRAAPPGAPARSTRSRYNKDTAGLFSLMGGGGYAPGTPQAHETNLWQLLRPAIAAIDSRRTPHPDYSDWSKKHADSASELALYACRDSIQWMASWCGSRYARQPAGVHYIAFSTICDDLCIPPADLVQGRFRLYGRSVTDLVGAMDDQGWGPDGSRALQDRYRERSLGHRLPLRPELAARLRDLFGTTPADPLTDQMFRQQHNRLRCR